MKNLILAIIVLITPLIMTSQGIGSQFNPTDLQSINTYNSLNTKSGYLDIKDINGSPYLNDKFIKGEIYEKENDQTVTTNMRYSIFEDKFEIKPNLNEQEVFTLKRSSNYEFLYGGQKVVLIQSKLLSKETKNGYLFVVHVSDQDGLNLYKEYFQNFTPPKKAKNSYSADKPGRLDTDTKYYISNNPNKELVELELHKKKILKSFDPKFENEIKNFIKSNNLKFKGKNKEEELIKLLNFYNSNII